MNSEQYLLSRSEAAHRYGISERELDREIRRNKHFPARKFGRRVLIHRDDADAYFTRYIREAIETE